MTRLLYYVYWVIYMKNLNFFALGSFEINNVNSSPITFEHGEKIQFTTTTLVSPPPLGLFRLTKSDLDSEEKPYLFSKLFYEDEDGEVEILQSFITPMDSLEQSSIENLYKVETPFEVDTSKISGEKGIFQLMISWHDGKEHGEIINIVLPIYEKA